MGLYLKNISLSEAVNKVRENCANVCASDESIDTRYSLGRVTARSIFAGISSPHFTASAMDGIAVKFTDTLEADLSRPIILPKEKFEVVDTGDPINDPFDSVIMVEDVLFENDGAVIRKPAVPYQNVRPIGEDIVMGSMILPSNHVIRPIDISSLLAGGINNVPVLKKIKVGVIPTGDEIVDAGKNPERGELLDFNSWTFCAMIQEWGGEALRYDIVKDDFEDIKAALKKASNECDMVIINAGSAKGRGDFTEDALTELGEVLFHGISIKPGRPASFAKIKNVPVFGVPGYPVSAYFVMEKIVREGYFAMLNIPTPKKENVDAVLTRRVVSSLKNDEFIRVKLGRVEDKIVATPVGKGAGVTMSLTNADGIFMVDKDREGIETGEVVKVELLRGLQNIDKALVSIGSHDVIMDIAADMMSKKGFDLSSTHVGSMGGIMALKRGEAHIAPSHILGDDGVYNIEVVKKYLGDDYVILKLVGRIQGFMVKRGNPLNIKDFNDLKRVRFVNRQKGSGTRLLLDYYLKKFDINPIDINGYTREELTHLTVAAQVAGGSADCGMGVMSAANYMDLDFIPISNEEYDIIVKRDFVNDERFKAFYEVVTSDEFKAKLYEIGGYSSDNGGKIINLEGKNEG